MGFGVLHVWLEALQALRGLCSVENLAPLNVLRNVVIYSRPIDGISGHWVALENALVSFMDIGKVGIFGEVKSFIMHVPSNSRKLQAYVSGRLASFGMLDSRLLIGPDSWQFLF